jgi:hypothetical protein
MRKKLLLSVLFCLLAQSFGGRNACASPELEACTLRRSAGAQTAASDAFALVKDSGAEEVTGRRAILRRSSGGAGMAAAILNELARRKRADRAKAIRSLTDAPKKSRRPRPALSEERGPFTK